jgi:membrane protein
MMSLGDWKKVLENVWADIMRNHSMVFAAGLSFYFLLGFFPALIALAAIIGFLPIPDLFHSVLDVVAKVVPPDSMGLVRQVVNDVISPNRGKLLSFGVVGSFWAVSTGFASLMEALNVAYDVPETRPYWKTRLLAMRLSVLIGSLMLVALILILLGPEFGRWVAVHAHLSKGFALAWPYIRWTFSVVAVVLGVGAIYFAGPNVRQSFRYTAPGAIVAVAAWLGLSFLLGLYFRRIVNLNHTYGTLGGVVALMIWLQWTALILLIGAEINAEVLKLHTKGEVPLKFERRRLSRVKPGSEWAA